MLKKSHTSAAHSNRAATAAAASSDNLTEIIFDNVNYDDRFSHMKLSQEQKDEAKEDGQGMCTNIILKAVRTVTKDEFFATVAGLSPVPRLADEVKATFPNGRSLLAEGKDYARLDECSLARSAFALDMAHDLINAE